MAVDGLDIIGMSLGDVIYDIENKTFFTPNTGTVADQKGNITKEGVVVNGPADTSDNTSGDASPGMDEDNTHLEKGGDEGES